MSENQQLHPHGIIVPLLTPLTADENVNFEHLNKLVDHVIEGGVDGIFVMGTSGEASRFTMDERAEIVKAVADRTAGRVPVYAGVSDCGTRLVKRHAVLAKEAGADAVVTTLPYYFPTTSQKEARAFLTDVADASPLPVILYNIPATVQVGLSVPLVEEMSNHPNIIAVKDSSADAQYLTKLQVRCQREDFSVLVGDEAMLFQGFMNGVDGCIPSMANPYPRLLAALYRAAVQGDAEGVKRFSGIVDRFNRLNKFCDSWMSPNIWRKTALSLMGVMDEYFTTPYEPVTDSIRAKVAATVEEYNDLIAKGIL